MCAKAAYLVTPIADFRRWNPPFPTLPRRRKTRAPAASSSAGKCLGSSPTKSAGERKNDAKHEASMHMRDQYCQGGCENLDLAILRGAAVISCLHFDRKPKLDVAEDIT